MPSFEPVRFGLIGGGWITEQHIKAIAAIPEAEVLALADYPRAGLGRPRRAAELAGKVAGGNYYGDYREMLEDPRIEVVTVSLPNSLHAEVAIRALEHGKHLVVEKPLCFTLSEARRMVALAKEKQLCVGYAEELCFCPKLVRGKSLVDQGAVGELFFVHQIEAHGGPYSEWFFTPELAGGGALMDMGCHSIEYARWMLGKRPIQRVSAQLATYVHREPRSPLGALEDHAIVHLELEGGASALLESGWALQGGMQSRSRLLGSRGALELDLLRGNGIELFSQTGLLGEGILPGWSRLDFEWLWQNGYPQEMAEFARAIREGRGPSESGEDGLAVLEALWAAYLSAASGSAVSLPLEEDPPWRFPAEPWLRSRSS